MLIIRNALQNLGCFQETMRESERRVGTPSEKSDECVQNKMIDWDGIGQNQPVWVRKTKHLRK